MDFVVLENISIFAKPQKNFTHENFVLYSMYVHDILPPIQYLNCIKLQEQEQMRLERIWAQQEKDKQVAEALAKFAAMQTDLKSKASKVAQSEISSSDELVHQDQKFSNETAVNG